MFLETLWRGHDHKEKPVQPATLQREASVMRDGSDRIVFYGPVNDIVYMLNVADGLSHTEANFFDIRHETVQVANTAILPQSTATINRFPTRGVIVGQ